MEPPTPLPSLTLMSEEEKEVQEILNEEISSPYEEAFEPFHITRDYKVLRIIGKGAFSVVLLCTDIYTEKDCAIKVLCIPSNLSIFPLFP